MKIEEMISNSRADCSGCEACANVCPKNAIVMTRDVEGFVYPKINLELCIECGRCDATCPSLNFKTKTIDDFPKTFVAIYPNEKILRHSSSGGIFTALSEIILRDGGIVFGAGFDKNWRIVHTSAENLDELENLRGSKYTQSKIGDVYRQVRDALKSSKVLFSGTPCQCVGLKHFLGKDYDNLLTVEIICHGTPSPALWESYIDELNDAHEVKHVNFRSKRKGWAISHMEINFSDTGYYIRPVSEDIYGKLFLKGISERPSCHACKFKFPNGKSDLTLGDAWGIESFAPEMFNNRGVSAVFIHTAKGNEFFERTKLIKRQVAFPNAIMKNRAFVMAFSADPRREIFFNELANGADKVAVMQKYFYQDDSSIRRKINEYNNRALSKIYQELAAQIRQKFKENILFVGVSPQNLEKDFQNCGVYILQFVEGKIICLETFSLLALALREEPAALSDFVNKINVTEIYVGEPLKVESPVVSEWLKTCELPVQTLDAK